MKLRNIILSLLLAVSSLAASAQTYRSDFVDFNDEMSQGFLEEIRGGELAFDLEEYGWVRNGRLVDAVNMHGKGQVWYLAEKMMLHINTGDGDCVYDSRVADGRIYLTNQRKMVDKDINRLITTNAKYKGWLKIVGMSKDFKILMLDNIGVYRILTPTKCTNF